VAAVTPNEYTEQVVSIACEVFGRPVRPQDNFYDLGGDSMGAIEFAARLEAWAGRDVSVALVTAAPDLRTLAGKLRSGE
jgi:phthiocerol/phenolphthiocerol synthesis type-I polyketide synthase E